MKYKVGQIVRVIKNTINHNYQIGNIYKIKQINNLNNILLEDGENTTYLTVYDISPYYNMDDLMKSIKELKRKYRLIKDIISIIDQTNNNELDINFIKSYKILKLENKNLDNIKKIINEDIDI